MIAIMAGLICFCGGMTMLYVNERIANLRGEVQSLRMRVEKLEK